MTFRLAIAARTGDTVQRVHLSPRYKLYHLAWGLTSSRFYLTWYWGLETDVKKKCKMIDAIYKESEGYHDERY